MERLPSDGWHPGTLSPSLLDLMSMDEAGWEAFSRGSLLRRAGRGGFLRNVAVALGNWAASDVVPVLTAALSDREPLVRGPSASTISRSSSSDHPSMGILLSGTQMVLASITYPLQEPPLQTRPPVPTPVLS